ncbi:MAG TPA: c-type cytochrome [Methylomirabilota bacterium]|nr:c-type cytochrome [Methylomirabilota bacterium]
MERPHWSAVLPVFALLAGAIWSANPPASRADSGSETEKHAAHGGDGKERKVERGHAHVSLPLEYADQHIPPEIWTDSALITLGKEIYTRSCAVCHGAQGDGKGPAGLALPLKPSDLTDQAAVAAMRDSYWFWRASEGGAVEPFKSRGSAMPPWKETLSVQDRWAVIAYQHSFSGHRGPHVPWEHPEMVQVGREIYTMACAACHGDSGKGDGSVGSTLSPNRAPQPRDFTSGLFKLRSTPSGQLPTTADLLRTVTEGIRSRGGPLTIGLSGYRIMPSFRHMPEEQRMEIVEYIKSLNKGFWARHEVKMVPIPAAPPMTTDRIGRGKQLYADAECLACHGASGRGDGPSAPTLKDQNELPIVATDLTQPSRFKNKSTPQDVFRTLMTGLAGTPMPSYADSLEPDQAWDLVYYVLSLSGQTAPQPALDKGDTMHEEGRHIGH